jgi:hypothetical protein
MTPHTTRTARTVKKKRNDLIPAGQSPAVLKIFFNPPPQEVSIDREKAAVITALKKHRGFRRLLSEYRAGKLILAYASEFDDVRNEKYPVFYVILNNADSPVELLIP